MRITALKGERGQKLWLANAGDGPKPGAKTHYGEWRELYEIQFSPGWIFTNHVLVWATSFDNAVEEAAEYAKERWSGIFVREEEMTEYYHDACKEHGVDPEKPVDDNDTFARMVDDAQADLTYTESGWIPSDQWRGHEVTDPAILKRASVAIEFEYDHLDWWD